jgi:hypothetical protein
LDFAKAFDKVNHKLLIHKLQHYGIIGKSVRWIQNWLANRKQSVVIDGSTSDAVSVDSGVPQGSVLGPGLFLYYIHDLQSRLTSTVRLFADDTIAYLTISDNIDAETLQKDLDKLGRPKYLADVTDSSVCPWSWYLASLIFFLLVTLSTVHLSGWNFMHHSFSQCPSLSRSFCRASASLLWDIVRYAIVSSAKIYEYQVTAIVFNSVLSCSKIQKNA